MLRMQWRSEVKWIDIQFCLKFVIKSWISFPQTKRRSRKRTKVCWSTGTPKKIQTLTRRALRRYQQRSQSFMRCRWRVRWKKRDQKAHLAHRKTRRPKKIDRWHCARNFTPPSSKKNSLTKFSISRFKKKRKKKKSRNRIKKKLPEILGWVESNHRKFILERSLAPLSSGRRRASPW